MRDLVVFISSIMDPTKDDLTEERRIAKQAVESIPLARAWRFEDSPASAQRVDYTYLNAVRDADLFLLLLGRGITAPVRMEYQAATDADKPRLVFLREAQDRSAELQAFTGTLDVKWKRFADLEQLRTEVRAALANELIDAFRREQLELQPSEVTAIEQVQAEAQAAGEQSGGVNVGGQATLKARNVAGRDQKVELRKAGRDYFEAREGGQVQVTYGAGAGELLELFQRMQSSLKELNLEPRQERRVQNLVEAAAIEAEEEKPDKTTVTEKLTEAAKVVKGATNLAVETTEFGKTVIKVLKWAGKIVAWAAI